MVTPRRRSLSLMGNLSLCGLLICHLLSPLAAQAAPSTNPLVAAEAFLDDPELTPGAGTPLTLAGDEDEATRVAAGALAPSGADLGAHTLYLRFQDQAGSWSAPLGQTYALTTTGSGGPSPGGAIRLVGAEAFVDQDPGQGRGIPLDQAADGAIDSAMEALSTNAAITGLVPGPHVLAVRFLDSSGAWSAPIRQSFFVAPGATAPGNGPTHLVAAAGQIDGGLAWSLPADDGAFGDLVETASLDDPVGSGYHSAIIRFQDNLGIWSNIEAPPGGCSTPVPVSGRLRDATTGAVLAGVSIQAGGATTVTDANGFFSFPGLSCGPQLVKVSVGGYASYQRLFDPAVGGWLEVRLTRPGTTYGFNSQSGYGGDPVNTATGNYVYSSQDLEIPGIGLPFRFERAYNSRAASETGAAGTPLGYGWTHSYQVSLSPAAGALTLTWGDGRTETFATDGSGGFTPQYGVFDRLSDLGDGRYALEKRDGSRYAFDTAGRLAAISDRNGNALTLTHTDGRLTRITDTAGRTMDFSYDGAGRLLSLTDPLGRTVRYTYDGNGNLISFEDSNGNLTRYTYDDRHQLLTLVDPRGHTVVNNTYDAERRVVTYQTDAKGGATSYDYQETDRVTTITDALGGVSVHYHDDLLRLIRELDPNGDESLYLYDEAGNRVQVVDKNGNLTEYGYDERGNVTRQRDALGGVTTIAYDDLNNPLTRTDALSQTTLFSYDSQGNLLMTQDAAGGWETRTYDGRGLLLTLTDPLGRTTTHGYDSQGNLTTLTDALGRTTSHTYDANGNPRSLTDPAGQTTVSTYDANDNRVSVTDRRGYRTDFAYDEKDLLVTITDAAGGFVRNSYDALDRKTGVRDRNGHLTSTEYDAAGHPLRVENALGQVTESSFDANGNRLSVIDPLGHITKFSFDALNRLVATEDALGHRATTEYDALGRVIARTDASGQITRLRYDALGRLTVVTDAAGGRVEYTYDLVGNRLSMTSPHGQTTRYSYDDLNRLISKIEPLGHTTTYAYDAVGNLTQITKPNGTLIRLAYDALDRLVTLTYPDTSQVNFSYYAEGHRIEMRDALGTSRFAYDALGRMTRYTDPRGQVVGYGYDAQGNQTSLGYPGGKLATYAYDAANRLTAVTDWFGRTTRYSYDAAGRLAETVNPNGTRASYGYDEADRLISLRNRQAGDVNIASYAYTLDAVGNPLEESRDEPLNPSRASRVRDYVYDAEDRLIAERGTANTFDANGSQTGKGTSTFAFDFEDRLLRSEIGGVIETYGYDGLGHRLTRTQGGVENRYVLDPKGEITWVLAETDAGGTVRTNYLYGLGLIARIAPNGDTHYYHCDSRGSTIALTDGSGAITDGYAYDPFGSLAASTGNTSHPFRYVGRQGLMDEGNGLLFVRARYYDPATGRFLSKDPQPGTETESQSLHRYIYGLDNPVRFVDVSGLSAREGNTGIDPSSSSDTLHNGVFRFGRRWRSAAAAEKYHRALLAQIEAGNAFVDANDVYIRKLDIAIGTTKIIKATTGAAQARATCLLTGVACVPGVLVSAFQLPLELGSGIAELAGNHKAANKLDRVSEAISWVDFAGSLLSSPNGKDFVELWNFGMLATDRFISLW